MGHHIWCNYWEGPEETCEQCKSLSQRFPEKGMTPGEMLKRYFPNVTDRMHGTRPDGDVPTANPDQFHKHLDECARCRQHPFDLCPIGQREVEMAFSLEERLQIELRHVRSGGSGEWVITTFDEIRPRSKRRMGPGEVGLISARTNATQETSR